jgi:hypothetical protein
LQDLKIHVDVALFSETNLKPYVRFQLPNYDIYRTCREDRQLRKASVTHAQPFGKTEIYIATVYKSPQKLWIDTDIAELLGFRNKSILAGDLNAKHPVWNSTLSNPSGLKLLELFVSPNCEISTPQCSTTTHLIV